MKTAKTPLNHHDDSRVPHLSGAAPRGERRRITSSQAENSKLDDFPRRLVQALDFPVGDDQKVVR